jgi:hypothetical protein
VITITDPIELEVTPTKILTKKDLQGIDSGPINRQLEAIKKGLFDHNAGWIPNNNAELI